MDGWVGDVILVVAMVVGLEVEAKGGRQWRQWWRRRWRGGGDDDDDGVCVGGSDDSLPSWYLALCYWHTWWQLFKKKKIRGAAPCTHAHRKTQPHQRELLLAHVHACTRVHAILGVVTLHVHSVLPPNFKHQNQPACLLVGSKIEPNKQLTTINPDPPQHARGQDGHRILSFRCPHSHKQHINATAIVIQTPMYL